MSSNPNDDYLERVKAEIRAEAEAARARDPLPRIEPPPRASTRTPASDGIERERLDYTIGELTGPDYRAFIDHAFHALLKRAPDDAGSAMQIRLLAAGAAKAEVLGNLRWSPEGRRVGARVRGLLPRYALAKLARVPVFGYFVEWGLVLAGLPMLLRHQRAADTSIAARFNAAADAQREHEQRLAGLQGAFASLQGDFATLSAEHDRRSEAIRDDIGRMRSSLDELERRTVVLEDRTRSIEQRSDASAREMIELRHYVHAANHWVTSLQRSLADLEDATAAERERADAFAAAIDEDADEAATRKRRYGDWSAALASRLPTGATVLDLGSGDGAWLEALGARMFVASGIEANHVLVTRAQQRHVRLAHGDPLAVLARCADASLDGITLSDSLLLAGIAATSELLRESRRALRPGGSLLVRVESEPYRFSQAHVANLDPQRWIALLTAAGFAASISLPATGGSAVLAHRSNP
ncbi:class I SAM-dependent methyltransferase [Dokdonella soli]|uniref:Methyltransferase domain-containing protein n=1 Tax=Dokdonella soli TaxID=529810 RepID=A0ABP3TMK6_9GAMM